VTQEIVTLITQLGPNWRAILSSMWEEPELPEILRGAHDFEVVDKARRRSQAFMEADIIRYEPMNGSLLGSPNAPMRP
jgi:hypothetical protein